MASGYQSTVATCSVYASLCSPGEDMLQRYYNAMCKHHRVIRANINLCGTRASSILT